MTFSQTRKAILERFAPGLLKEEPPAPVEVVASVGGERQPGEIVQCGCVVGRLSGDGVLVPLESMVAKQRRLEGENV
jgi:hypothetical protein